MTKTIKTKKKFLTQQKENKTTFDPSTCHGMINDHVTYEKIYLKKYINFIFF
jgi:hypothetical protein